MLSLCLNSLILSSLAAFIAVSIGAVMALGAASLPLRIHRVIFLLALITLAIPPFVVTNAWMQVLGQNSPVRMLVPFPLYSMAGAILVFSLMFWPIGFFLTLASWQKLDACLLESDPMLKGCSAIRYLFWPAARSQMGLALVITFVFCLNQFSVPALLQVKVFTAAIWIDFNTTFNYGSAWSMGWPMVMAPLLLLVFLFHVAPCWPQWNRPVSSTQFKGALGGQLYFCSSVLVLCVIALSAFLPLGVIIADNSTWADLSSAFLAGQSAVWNSFFLSSTTACLCVGIGLALSKSGMRHLFWIPFLVPGILLGILLVYLLNRPVLAYLYPNTFTVIFAWCLRYAILANATISKAVNTVDPSLIDAARLEGASRFFRMRHIYWPHASRSILIAWCLCYMMCLWDTETLIQIVPPGKETLSLRIFNLLHYGHNSQVNALCLILLVLSIIPWLLSYAGHRLLFAFKCTQARCLLFIPIMGMVGCSPSSSNSEKSLSSAIFEKARIIGSRGTGLGQFNKPRSLTVDHEDNLYVVDMTGRVQKFNANGDFVAFWQVDSLDKGKPKGMTVNKQGHILVAEPHYTRINHYTPDGLLVRQWGANGTNYGQLSFPRAVAVDSLGALWISEYCTMEHIQHFSQDGKQWLGAFGKAGSGPGEFNRVEGLWIDQNDRIYAADSCNHRIQVFSTNGLLLRIYGKPGAEIGQLSYPYDIIVDSTGMQYVCEFGNSRIQVFDASDKPAEIIGQPGNGLGQFHNPWSIAMDSAGNLYVADSGNHRVQKLTRRKSLMKIAVFPNAIEFDETRRDRHLAQKNFSRINWRKEGSLDARQALPYNGQSQFAPLNGFGFLLHIQAPGKLFP